MSAGRKGFALLAAAPLWLAAGCGSAPAPDTGDAPAPRDASAPPRMPSARPGYTLSCPPLPTADDGAKGVICREVPKPCSPRPCAGRPGDVLYVTGFERWTDPRGRAGYRLRWRFSREEASAPLYLSFVELRDATGGTVARRALDGEGCFIRHKAMEIPAGRTTVSPGPICMVADSGARPAIAFFHFWIEVGGGQTVREVPLTADGRRP
ncbi:hypothetical protein [Actinomadura sediminis]|uniref:Lipoprotein n=1 Tax=Actinomadura sediminis TaxID=1038904 RepID=A0ABW3EGN3_9ACTN